jgi:PTH1 family peptidyl-tRNA hydrolase
VNFRLIVGLGNPGKDYRDTRHNVGFMLLDRMAARSGVGFKTEKRWQADMAKLPGVFLCKPLTYMNLSGAAVRAVSDFYKIPAGEVLTVSDDLALPLGKLRLRPEGSAGGHNGLKSLIEHFGTQKLPRLRVGIGAPIHGAVTSHVLGCFGVDEKALLEESLTKALAAIDCAQARGLEAAMAAYN